MTIEELREQVCDNYCKFVGTCSEEELTEKCENCPMNYDLDDIVYDAVARRMLQ